MAERTPTPQDIEIPGLRGERPIASYDLSPVARGAQALARGVETLGTGIAKSAEDIAGAVVSKQHNDVQNSLMDYSNAALQDRVQRAGYNDLQSINNQELQRQQRREQFNAAVPPPTTALGAHAHGRADRIDAQEDLSIATQKRQISSSTLKADLANDLERITSGITYDPEHKQDAARQTAIDSHVAKIQSGIDHRDLTPLEGETYRKHAAQQVVDAEYHAVLTEALKQPKTPEGNAKAEELFAEGAAMIGRPLRYRIAPVLFRGPLPTRAFSLVSQAETNDPNVGPKGLGNRSVDADPGHPSSFSYSFGTLGINSRTGSLKAFVSRYGSQFGLTAPFHSDQFNAQWKAAANNQTNDFRAAQEDWFNENHLAPQPDLLRNVGIPAAVANDPRVMTYFADRHVQQGVLGLKHATGAWNNSGGDIPRFLYNMTQDDAARVREYYPTAISKGIYPAAGSARRLNTRFRGSLAAGTDGGVMTADGDVTTADGGVTPAGGGAAPVDETRNAPDHPATSVIRSIFSPEKIDAFAAKLNVARNQRYQDETREQTQAVTDRYNELERRVIDSASGRDSVARTEIERDPVLAGDEAKRNTLLRQWDTANKQDESLQAFIARFRDPNAGSFNQMGKDDKDNADKLYQILAAGGPEQEVKALQAMVSRTGIVPASAATAMRGALVSNSPQQVLQAAQTARNLLAKNPQIFTGVSGGNSIEEAAISFGQYTEHFGMTPEQAAQKIIQDNSPEYKAQVAARIKNEDVGEIVKKQLSIDDLRKEFNEGWRWNRPGVEFTEGAKATAFNDYAELFKSKYMETGNVDTAKAQAIEQMKKVWGVSFLNGTGSGTLMRYPPERAPAYADIPDVAARMADAAIAAIKTETAPSGPMLEAGAPIGEPVTRDKIILTPTVGGQTAQAYMAGQPVPYLLSWFDKAGQLHTLNPGRAFVFDPAAERERISEERRLGLEKGATSSAADAAYRERAFGLGPGSGQPPTSPMPPTPGPLGSTKAPDGLHYLPDKARPGKYLMLLHPLAQAAMASHPERLPVLGPRNAGHE